MINNVDKVMTTKEASKEFGIADCTIRQWIDQNQLANGDYRKSEGTWIMDRAAFTNLLRRKKIVEKTYEIDGKEIIFLFRGYKSKELDIWYEDERVKKILSDMPHANVVKEAFLAYKNDSGMKYKHLLITNNEEVSDNWFYSKNKTWVLTLRSVLETVIKSLDIQGIDISSINQYLKENRL
jgi:hypothetical protein